MTKTHPSTTSERTTLMELTGSSTSHTVTVSKVISKGERLEIAAGEAVIKLDSLILESLSWQRSPAGLCDIVADPAAVQADPVIQFEIDDIADKETYTVASEYSSIDVSKVEMEEGDGLQLVSPGRGAGTILGTATLQELASIEDTFEFSEWFRTPFGPEDTPTDGAI